MPAAMKLLLPVFAALGFLVTPAASGGKTNCGLRLPGHCRLRCGPLEKSLFMCDKYKQCCVEKYYLVPEPIMPPPFHRSKNPCGKSTISQNKEQEMPTTPKPLSPPRIQSTVASP